MLWVFLVWSIFYEVISTILSYLRLGVAEKYAHTLSGFSAYLFWFMIPAHAIGLLISLFGVRELLQQLGTRICLMVHTDFLWNITCLPIIGWFSLCIWLGLWTT